MGLTAATELSLLRIVTVIKKTEAYQSIQRASFVSPREARGQVEDCIKRGKVIARSEGSAGPDPSKYKVRSVMLNGAINTLR